MDTVDVSFNEIAEYNSKLSLENNIILYDGEGLSNVDPINYSRPPIRLQGVCFFICKSGKMSFSIDYKPHRLTKNMLLSLQSLHIIENIHVSAHSKVFMFALSQELFHSFIGNIPEFSKLIMLSTNRSKPVEKLEEDEMRRLLEIIDRIKKKLNTTGHSFKSHIIKNEASNFIFEVADIKLKRITNGGEIFTKQETRKEEITRNFLQLIFEHCKEQHEVSFYAKSLCMTSGNLTRIMKSSTGKTPLKWISDVIITESKILLHKQNISIKQISEMLHFGDQSSFGKFFKKHTGFTPIEYKNNTQGLNDLS